MVRLQTANPKLPCRKARLAAGGVGFFYVQASLSQGASYYEVYHSVVLVVSMFTVFTREILVSRGYLASSVTRN